MTSAGLPDPPPEPLTGPPDDPLPGPLAGTVALVAGGAGAVGEEIVAGFLTAGATVIVPSRDADRLEALRGRFGAPPALGTVHTDIADPDEAAGLRDRVLTEHGRLDAVVASVGGWWQGGTVGEVDLATWDRLIATNLRPHVVLAQTFLPVLGERTGSSYLAIVGDAAEQPTPRSAPVSVTTAGVLMLIRTAAAELAGSPVRVNALLLGPLITRSRPKGKKEWLTAEEVGRFAAYLASPAGAMVSGSVVRLSARPAPQ